MKSFDEWYKEAKKLNDDGFSAKDFFEAGQQSKQTEVDHLQKRIDGILEGFNNYDYTNVEWLNGDRYIVNLEWIKEKLKGDQS